MTMVGFMPPSPKGRQIEHVEGTPGDIVQRGNDIERLGQQMLDSAETLQRLHDNSFEGGGQRGQAIEKLQESIGDSYKTLKQAGELYHPVGPVIARYGETLETYKPRLDRSADTCQDLWTSYDNLPGDKDGSLTPEADGGFLGMGGHDADSPEAKEDAENNQAKKQAYDAWEDEAERFDTWYDAWESGFDDAVAGITDDLSGSIKDGFWEALDDFVSALEWAALVIGVVALVLTGPFAAIALALSAAVLAIRMLQAATSHGSWADVGWAALGILPFGKGGRILSSAGKGFAHGTALSAGRFGKYAGKFAGGAKGLGKASFRTFKQQFNFSTPIVKKSLTDVGVSALTGKTSTELRDLFPAGKATVAGVWDAAHGTIGQVFTFNDWGYKIASGLPGDNPSNWRDHTVLDVPW